MKSHTVYRTFQTEQRREFVRITEDVQAAVDEAGVSEGLALVAAMHITAGRLDQRRRAGPPGGRARMARQGRPAELEAARERRGAAQLLPDPGDYRHHRGGEDNGDAHLKNLLVHHQAIVPVTEGRLDLGPWQQVFYTEFDGRRPKRLVIKIIGE